MYGFKIIEEILEKLINMSVAKVMMVVLDLLLLSVNNNKTFSRINKNLYIKSEEQQVLILLTRKLQYSDIQISVFFIKREHSYNIPKKYEREKIVLSYSTAHSVQLYALQILPFAIRCSITLLYFSFESSKIVTGPSLVSATSI